MSNSSTVYVQPSPAVLSTHATVRKNSYDGLRLSSCEGAVQAPSIWIRWHGYTHV